MVEGLYLHVSQLRSIGCNHAPFLAGRDDGQQRSKPGRTGPAMSTKAGTADECGPVPIKLPMESVGAYI